MKARGNISPTGGHEAHLSAIAYMSDSYFVGTIARAHKLWRYSNARKSNAKSSIDEDVLKKLLAMDESELKRMKFIDEADIMRLRRLRNGEDISMDATPEIGMMVSLDHTIYFHNPRSFRADEWIFTEMETPWAGDGRGLVFQRMYTADGTLIASCVQEVCPCMVPLTRSMLTHIVLGCCSSQAERQQIVDFFQALCYCFCFSAFDIEDNLDPSIVISFVLIDISNC